jgi:hypothetical protein
MRLILRRSMPSSRVLAAACNVPGPYRLLHRWCTGSHGWCIVLRRGCCLALITCRSGGLCGAWLGSDERHEEFGGSGQGQRGPGADQRPDWAVVQAVSQVLADGGGDAGAQAPARQGWCGPVAPVGVEDEHAGGQQEPVDGEGQKPGGQAGFAVDGDEFVGVPVGDDGGDRGDGGGGDAVVILISRPVTPA